MTKETRTVCGPAGIPILEIVKSEDGNVTIYAADDMDNHLQFAASMIPSVIEQLETLIGASPRGVYCFGAAGGPSWFNCLTVSLSFSIT